MSTVISFGKVEGTTGVLAEQELRTALAICCGLTNKRIAQAIGCAPGTVKKTIERIFFKLDVSSRAALVAEAFKRGVIAFACNMAPDEDPHNQHHQESTQGILIA